MHISSCEPGFGHKRKEEKMKKREPRSADVESFNENILHIDLDDLEVDAMEQRIELALASIFDDDVWDGPGDPSQPCGQFSCDGYWPAA